MRVVGKRGWDVGLGCWVGMERVFGCFGRGGVGHVCVCVCVCVCRYIKGIYVDMSDRCPRSRDAESTGRC